MLVRWKAGDGKRVAIPLEILEGRFGLKLTLVTKLKSYTIPNIRPHSKAGFISPLKKMTRPEPSELDPFVPITLDETANNEHSQANRGAKLDKFM